MKIDRGENVKVLVTGGSGYLGTVLVPKLLEKHYEVSVFDLKTPVGLRYNDFTYIHGDIRNEEQCISAIEGQDAIIHLAAIVGDQACLIDQELAFQTNVKGTENLAKNSEGKRFIMTSTCSVYGIIEGVVSDEKTMPNPISHYGSTKLEAEKMVATNNTDNHIIFRLGTLYGWSEQMRWDLVINTFVKHAWDFGKIRVFGGNQYRPLLHIQDAADMLTYAVEKGKSGTYNLAYKNYTIAEVANQIVGSLAKKKIICKIDIENSVTDRRNYSVNCYKAKQKLAFRPKKTIPFAVEEIWGELCGTHNRNERQIG